MEIAPLDEALTFARAGDRLIAVRSYDEGRVKGVDLGPEDAIDIVDRLGYDVLVREIAAGDVVEATDLEIPVRLAGAHIAVGTNYREHADEASVKGGPFLFPKMVTPTISRAPIPAGGLLDYEVELCLIGSGLILCNDVTDRATLLRRVDPRNPQSGRGFTDGKSAPGYLPVGDLFVVPRDMRSFVVGLILQLSVNGEERQNAPAAEWIWDFDEIRRQAEARRDVTWAWREGTARLPLDEPRAMIMAGTPAGTVFQGIGRKDIAGGLWRWAAGGWGKPPTAHVVEQHIASARGYLQPGDVVSIRVERMGTLSNRVQ